MFCILIYLNISCDLKHHTENLLRFRHPKSSIRHPESWIKRHYSWDLIIILILYNNCECTHSSGGTLSREAVCRLHCCVSRRCSFRCHSLPLPTFSYRMGENTNRSYHSMNLQTHDYCKTHARVRWDGAKMHSDRN